MEELSGYALVANIIWKNLEERAEWTYIGKMPTGEDKYSISFEIAGYKYEGWGYRDWQANPQRINCTMPNGETIRIY